MTELEKVEKELARIREDHFGGMTSYEGEVLDAALALLKAQGLRYTPREVRNALMDYGQHDLNIKLGEIIKYDPVQIEDILMNGREVTSPVTPHMVDWGIYECPKCKTRVDTTYNYCKCCGRAVKWE